MKKTLRLGDFKACFYKDITPDEHASVFGLLDSWAVGDAILQKTVENVKTQNCGSTICNEGERHIIVLLGPQSSKAELLNTLSHEIRHVVDIIALHCPESHTSPACITGEITSHFADWL